MPTAVSFAPTACKWVQRGDTVESAEALAALEDALKLPTPLCQLLFRRGFSQIDDAKLYLKPRLDQLLDPFQLRGMSAAVDRIERAISQNEIILVHGDYDVDGICAAVLF